MTPCGLVSAKCVRFPFVSVWISGLTYAGCFDIFGNMKIDKAVAALAALAQDTRLAVFRLLVVAGPQGTNAGAISAALGIPPATLSFHLAQLSHAGLIVARQEGRFVFYSAHFDTMNELVGYLTENCCGGKPCPPAARKRKKSVSA